MVGVITLDAGDTAGLFTGPRVADILYELSGIPDSDESKRDIVGEAERTFLHVHSELTSELLQGLCGALIIDQDKVPDPWPGGGFEPYDYTNSVLADLRSIAPVVVLTNISMVSASCIRELAQKCGDFIDEIITSYDAGVRKPNPRLWTDIARVYNVPASKIVHIGDRWNNDVLGAASAGARAIHVCGTRHHQRPAPMQDEWPVGLDRISVVPTLEQVPAVIRQWIDDDLPRMAG